MEANFKLEEVSYFLEGLKGLVKEAATHENIQEIDKKFKKVKI